MGERGHPTALTAMAAMLWLSACATAAPGAGPQSGASPAATAAGPPRPPPRPGLDPIGQPDAYASTYRPASAGPIAIINATILTAAGPRLDNGVLLIRGGKIEAVGVNLNVSADARVIDARGRWVTPGIIDPHSHIGVGSSPGGASGDRPNESVNPAALSIEHSTWAQDPMFQRAVAAGVTTVQLLPGSGNFINGRTVILKNVPALTVQAMKFPGAVGGLKFACGENPFGAPPPGMGGGKASTRAGGLAAARATLAAAAEYGQRLQAYRRSGGEPPRRDLANENIAAALSGEIKVQMHCYRADDMLQMINLSHEFGFKITAFHHANEAFKIAPLLAREGIAVATWAGDWSGYKMEAYDSIMETAAFVERAGGLVAMHSDDVMLMQHLNQEAARAMAAGKEAGIEVAPEQAIRWVTLNPAKIIGVADQTGSLEAGKMADVVLWDTDPFSVYALPDLVFIDGVLVHDRAGPGAQPRSDFELGNVRRREPAAHPVPRWEHDR